MLKLFLFGIILFSVSCNEKTDRIMKNHESVIKKEIIPPEIGGLKSLIDNNIENIIVTLDTQYSNDIYELKVLKSDSTFLFSYSILSKDLPDLSLKKFDEWSKKQSCMINPGVSKLLSYGNLTLRPYCSVSSLYENEKDIVQKFYKLLYNNGATER